MSTAHQRKTFILPAFHATDHLLDRTSELGQSQRRPIGTIAVWSGAIDDEQHVGFVVRQVAFIDATVGQVHRSGQVSSREEFRAAHVQQRESLIPVHRGGVHILAVGLVRQQPREMGNCVRRGPWRNVGHWIGIKFRHPEIVRRSRNRTPIWFAVD